MVIVLGFQIPVDGWLTKLSAPIVIYDDPHTSGVRFPFDIPVEDFLFGLAMVTAALLLWERARSDARFGPAVNQADGTARRCPRRRADRRQGVARAPRVVVVGAGIAGLAAAAGLAERGVASTSSSDGLPRRPGRRLAARPWPTVRRRAMNRGFHAFFRQYYNLRDLLRRADPDLSALTPVDDYPLIDARRAARHFRGLPRPRR